MSDRGLGERIDAFLTHPFSTVVAGLSFIATGFGFDPFTLFGAIFGALGATAGTWFPLLGLLHTMSGLVAWIPEALTQQVFLAGVVLYGSYLLLRFVPSFIDSIKQRLKQNS